jgi:hypothetical protein
MSDWIGIGIFLLVIAIGYLGIRALANQKPRTTEEFERNAAENTTMLGSSMNALHELMNPAAAKSKEVQMQMKEGRYGKKKREGKANDGDEGEER